MISVIVPMAGAGSRFREAGYALPKPFVDINGRMMIERVLDSIRIPAASYTLIIQEQFKSENRAQLRKLQAKYPVRLVCVKGLTQGACCTALAARIEIPRDDAVVFVDSDNIFGNNTFSGFIQDALNRRLDGSLLTVKSDKNCFSYAKTNLEGLVTETKEKEVISDHAIAGAYLFRCGKDFIDCAIDLMIYGDKSKNEYYMSGVYNRAVLRGLRIGIYEINHSDWECVGTPEQLQAYLATL